MCEFTRNGNDQLKRGNLDRNSTGEHNHVHVTMRQNVHVTIKFAVTIDPQFWSSANDSRHNVEPIEGLP